VMYLARQQLPTTHRFPACVCALGPFASGTETLGESARGSARTGHTATSNLARLGTATNSANVAQAGRAHQIVGHQPRLRERQQVPARKHVGLDAEPVVSNPALQADREETVVIAG
jgi:hypothetical protein